MKIAIWLLSIAVVVLAGIAIWQMNIIKSLTPAQSAGADPNIDTNRTMRFGDMVKEFQKQAKILEVKATY